MKKYLVILASAITALTMASCTKEEAAKVPANGTTISLQANLDNETKTVSAESSPLLSNWLSTDKLTVIYYDYVNETYSDAFQFTCADADKGIFTGTIDKTLSYDDETIYGWYMVYPYNKYLTAVKPSSPANADTDGFFTIGSKTQTQNGINSSKHALAGSNAPLVGLASSGIDWTEPAEMHHLTSVLQFNITNTEEEDVTVSSIYVKAPVSISGTYFVDFSDVEDVTYTEYNANNYVTLTVKEGTIPAGETASFYIVTKPFDVAANSSTTISITADAGNVNKTWTPAEEVSVEAGHIKTFNIDYSAPKSTSFARILGSKTTGTYLTSSATVTAAGPSYAVAYDGTDWMVLYNSKINGATAIPTVGNNYQVSGNVTCFYGLMEWSAATLTDLGAATSITHPDVEEFSTSDLEAYITNTPASSTADPVDLLHYIKIPVTVSSGTIKDGDYVINAITSSTLNDGEGTITGYLIGYNKSKSSFNVIITESGITASEPDAVSLTAPYTLNFPISTSNKTYAILYDVTVDNVSWKVPGNQSVTVSSTDSTPVVKLGGKLTEATDRAIYSRTPISNNFSSVTVYNGAQDSQITVNSMTLTVYKKQADVDAGTNAIATITGTFAANGTTTFAKTGTESWANCYYKINYNLSSSASSKNYGVQFIKAVFAE